jgi:hypothetical protein
VKMSQQVAGQSPSPIRFCTSWPISTEPSPLLSIDIPCGPLSLLSCSYIAGCFQLVAQSAATCSGWFHARGFFYPEDGDTFLQNIGSHKIFGAPHPRRRHSTSLLCYSHSQTSDCEKFFKKFIIHLYGKIFPLFLVMKQQHILSFLCASLQTTTSLVVSTEVSIFLYGM